MQIGGALGSTCAWLLRVDARERRILMVSGVAAGIAAVFRTPLGAALLAVEVLYRDDFESDALIPAVLASVVAYSVVISIFGESTLFAIPGHYPFIIKHLPLYALLALLVSVLAAMFLSSLRTVQRVTASLTIPRWARPGAGRPGARRVLRADRLCSSARRWRSPARGWACWAAATAPCRSRSAASTGCPSDGRASALLAVPVPGEDRRVVADDRLGRQRRRLRAALVIGGLFGGAFGRAAQMLLARSAHRPGRVRAGRRWERSTAASRTRRCRRWCWCASWRAATTCSCRSCWPKGSRSWRCASRSLYRAQLPTQRDSPVHQHADARRPALDARRRGDAHGVASAACRSRRRRSASAPTPTCAPPPRRC